MAKKFAGVLAPWMESKVQAGQSGDEAYAKLQDELKKMFEELRTRIENEKFPKQINTACASAGNRYNDQDKLICKTLVRTVYWMNGIDEESETEVDNDKAGEKELREHLRCIVGYSSMIKLLSNKCDVEEVVGAVNTAAAGQMKTPGIGTLNEKCRSVTYGDLSFGAKILEETLREWVRKGNRDAKWLSIYMGWELCPPRTKAGQNIMNEVDDPEKEIMQLLKEKKAPDIYNRMNPPTSPASPAAQTPSEDILKQVIQNATSCSSAPRNGNMKDCVLQKLETVTGK